jgi:hypothetical protein
LNAQKSKGELKRISDEVNVNRLLLVFVFFFAIHVQGGVRVEMDQKGGETKAENCNLDTLIDLSFVRGNIQCEGGTDVSMIFDDKAETNYTVDHKQATYWTMTLAESKEMARGLKPQMDKMKEIQAQMRERMKNLPPAQKEMMEKMMASQSPVVTEGATVKKSGPAKTVGKYKCHITETWLGKEKIRETCIADWSQSKINFSKYTKIASKWSSHWDEIAKSNPRAQAMKDGDWTKGFVVEARSFLGGKLSSEMTLKSIKEDALSADLSKPPANYKKELSPIEMMRAQAAKTKK